MDVINNSENVTFLVFFCFLVLMVAVATLTSSLVIGGNVSFPIPNREDLNSSELLHHQVNSAYNQLTKAELIIYQHAVLSAPPVATLIKAIKNKWLTLFPGMTVDLVMEEFT